MLSIERLANKIGSDRRNFHILRYEEIILDYTPSDLNFMITKMTCSVACQKSIATML